MAKDPGRGNRVVATIIGVKGQCAAGHIFPSLCAFQFGGNLPWWKGDTISQRCPDSDNLVTLKLERSERT